MNKFIANVECQLTYTNDTYEPLQTSFLLALDDMSAVYKFEADINGRHIVAECQEKEQVRQCFYIVVASHLYWLLYILINY